MLALEFVAFPTDCNIARNEKIAEASIVSSSPVAPAKARMVRAMETGNAARLD
ncbi:hypothetical protein ISF62_18385 [Burkholderia pseudomallei]|uniref:hypothetical protein n=1 Tax=Burkholderia pseudomallei TaxID=28450 RepID=UPI001605253B|nr:hypothetical protein [Burkholderia pseudomallei]MBF3577488.1 hypothetical protein [Burkholderia pseudomallei]